MSEPVAVLSPRLCNCGIKQAFPVVVMLRTRPVELRGVLGEPVETADLELDADCIEAEDKDKAPRDSPSDGESVPLLVLASLSVGEWKGRLGECEFEPDEEEGDLETVAGAVLLGFIMVVRNGTPKLALTIREGLAFAGVVPEAPFGWTEE